MAEAVEEKKVARVSVFQLPRNVWAVSLTSFFMDVSSEMVINILPLFLANVLGVQTSIIGLIEGIAEATASILKLFSGWLSDKMGGRKWLAVSGYALSAVSKPFFYIASSWELIAGVRWADRIGKGVRTAPRDALVADSVTKETRGLAFGFHRAMDTAGAMVGILIAVLVVWLAQKNALDLTKDTFRTVVLISLLPAFLAVLSLAVGAQDVAVKGQRAAPKFSLRSMGRPFTVFLVIVSIFTLGNSSDAFLVLRAQTLGMTVTGILVMLAMFNLIYSLVSTPAGSLSDRVGRRRLIIGGWLVYAAIYLGFAAAQADLAGVAAVCGLRPVLRHGLRDGERPGGRPGAREPAGHGLRDLQRHHRHPGLPGLPDRRRALAGRWGLERLWAIGALPVRRDAGAGSRPADGLLAAAGQTIIVNQPQAGINGPRSSSRPRWRRAATCPSGRIR